jgi:hypothetical protein
MALRSSKVFRGVFSICQRTYSTQTLRNRTTVIFIDNGEDQRRNTLLGPSKQFPFPGDVASSTSFSGEPSINPAAVKLEEKQPPTEPSKKEKDIKYKTINVAQLLHNAALTKSVDYEPPASSEEPRPRFTLSLNALDSPALLKNELNQVFSEVDLEARNVTVVNVGFALENETPWNEAMEVERMQLMSMFIELANTICVSLHHSGYWADFVDPRSGRPYLGRYADTQVFETDDRYRHLSFDVENVGPCKMVKTVPWGEQPFFGSIFTDAPIKSDTLRDIIEKLEMAKEEI